MKGGSPSQQTFFGAVAGYAHSSETSRFEIDNVTVSGTNQYYLKVGG